MTSKEENKQRPLLSHSTQISSPLAFQCENGNDDNSSKSNSFFVFFNKIQAVGAALGDVSVLVQRSTLDFILAFLPLDTLLIAPKEKVTLVAAALEVLLRRDMSLNRRLYTWLLGTNSEKEENLSRTDSVCSSDADREGPAESFFSLHSRPFVIEAVRKVFLTAPKFERNNTNGGKKARRLEVLKPFRMLISLLDKPEIAGSILEDVLLDVFRALYSQCKLLRENGAAFEESEKRDSIDKVPLGEGGFPDNAKTKLIDELIKTANLLFNAFEPYFMWEYIAKLLSDCDKATSSESRCGSEELSTKPSTSCAEVFRLTDFILDVVTLASFLFFLCTIFQHVSFVYQGDFRVEASSH